MGVENGSRPARDARPSDDRLGAPGFAARRGSAVRWSSTHTNSHSSPRYASCAISPCALPVRIAALGMRRGEGYRRRATPKRRCATRSMRPRGHPRKLVKCRRLFTIPTADSPPAKTTANHSGRIVHLCPLPAPTRDRVGTISVVPTNEQHWNLFLPIHPA